MFRYNDPQEVNRLRMNSSVMSNNELGTNQMNLSRIFSQSSDLTKSMDNIWSNNNNNVDYSDLDLEEKRKEIEELEEEHRRAEERRKEEETRADEELKKKKAELCMLKDESDTLNKLIEESIKAKEQAESELKLLNEQREQFKQLAIECNPILESTPNKPTNNLHKVNSTDLISIELDDGQDSQQSQNQPNKKTSNILIDVELNDENSDNESSKSTLKLNELRSNNSDIKDILTSFAQRFKLNEDGSNTDHLNNLVDLDETTIKQNTIVEQKAILNHFEELINTRFKELMNFEEQLKDMEKELNQQKQLYEMQRNKELGAIEKEKYNLEKMEKHVKLEALIEKEVQRRLKGINLFIEFFLLDLVIIDSFLTIQRTSTKQLEKQFRNTCNRLYASGSHAITS